MAPAIPVLPSAWTSACSSIGRVILLNSDCGNGTDWMLLMKDRNTKTTELKLLKEENHYNFFFKYTYLYCLNFFLLKRYRFFFYIKKNVIVKFYNNTS